MPDLGDAAVADDRGVIAAGDRVLLVVAEDTAFAELAVATGRRRGFKVVVTLDPQTGLRFAREGAPDAVMLAMDAATADGTPLLAALKRSPATRHIPTHVIDTAVTDDRRHRALQAGALAVLPAPITSESLAEALAEIASFIDRRVRRLLVVEDNDTERGAILDLVGAGEDVEATGVATADEALAALNESRYDCMVLDLNLPGVGGFELLERLKNEEGLVHLPVIIYTGKELDRRDETKLRKYADAIIVKDARSPERLLDETALFLHRVESELPPTRRRLIEHLRGDEAIFVGRRILIVDDDVRNVFALTSSLEQQGMEVVYAENGREALQLLERDMAIDLVLMDVMMPELDGYATTRAIRQLPRYSRLPVITLTAKAMKGDREKSIEAGASDYVTKPVDIEQLLSLMRVWLYR